VGFAYDRHTFLVLVAFLVLAAGIATLIASSRGHALAEG
jgi:hypothetical protein